MVLVPVITIGGKWTPGTQLSVGPFLFPQEGMVLSLDIAKKHGLCSWNTDDPLLKFTLNFLIKKDGSSNGRQGLQAPWEAGLDHSLSTPEGDWHS